MKNSADIHDQIDTAIATDTAHKEHDAVPKVWDDIEDNENLDKTHVHKIAQHFMSTHDQNWDLKSRGNRTFESALSHPKTESKTINDYLAHPASASPIDIPEESINKPGVDSKQLTDFLSKKIESDSANPVGVSSDVLRNLKQIAENKDQEAKTAYHGFIGQSYAKGPRDASDFEEFKPILDSVLDYSDDQTIQNLFDEHHNIPHNSIMDMYHKIDYNRRQKLLKSRYDDFNPMNHPNIDKDYVAAAALDPSHELNEKAIKSKNLPHHVIDRFIGDQNNEMISKVMESENLAPEHVEKLSEYAVNNADLHDTLNHMMSKYSDHLPEKSVNKLYSMFRGANLQEPATNLAESANASDEVFMDSVNRGEKPSLYNREVTPELVNQLSDNSEYAYSLLFNDKTPEDVKNKIVQSGNVPFKDVSSQTSKLSYGVSKAYLKEFKSKNKLNAGLMKNIYFGKEATPEDKHEILDMAVKGFKNKEKTKHSSAFFGDAIKAGDKEATGAFEKLKPEHQASVIDHMAEQYQYDFSKIDMTKSFATSLLDNEHISRKAKLKIMANPSVDFESTLGMVGQETDHYQSRVLTDRLRSKIDNSSDEAKKSLLEKYTKSFNSLPISAKAALVTSKDFDVSKINLEEKDLKDLPAYLGDNESDFISKMSPDQAATYLKDKDVRDFQTHEFAKMSKSHPELINKILGNTKHDLSVYMNDKDRENIGQDILPHNLSSETTADGAWNFGYLYNYNKDPDSSLLRQALDKYGSDPEHMNKLFRSMRNNGGNPFDKETIDKLREFGPSGLNYKPEVWSTMLKQGQLPDDLRYDAALTDPNMAQSHIASVHGDHDHEIALQEINKMMGDERLSPESFDTLLEEKNVLSGLSDNREHHSQSLLDNVVGGFSGGKVNAGNVSSVTEQASMALKDVKDESVKDKFIKNIVTHLDASQLDPHIKDLYISRWSKDPSVPEVTKKFVEDRIINNAIKQSDIYRLSRLGGGGLTNNPKAWAHSDLNTDTSRRMLDFVEMASTHLTDVEGNIVNPQNWLTASKSMMGSIGNMEPDDFHHRFGITLGNFISAGSKNSVTKDVANLMAKAWATKMSLRGSRDNGFDGLVDILLNNGNLDTAVEAFKGVQGPIAFGMTESKELDAFAKHVTNAHQAAAIVENLGQDRKAKDLILKFKDMVSPDSFLGRNIAIKMTDNHPFMTQEEANSVVSQLSEKDPNSFFDMLSVGRSSFVSSAKMVSVSALNLPNAIKNGISKGLHLSNMIKAASEFCERVNERDNDIAGLTPEDGKIARNHLMSNYIDSCAYAVDETSSSQLQSVKEDAGDLHRALYRNFDSAFRTQLLTKDQTDKVFALAEKLHNDRSVTSYKQDATNTVHYIGFANGNFDHGKMSEILSKYPSSVFAAAGNPKFQAEHVQHFKPKHLFDALLDKPNKSVEHLHDVNKAVMNFFTTLGQRDEGTFNDEDKVKIRQKGFEYLNEYGKFIENSKMKSNIYNVENTVKSIIEASSTNTLAEDSLNYIVANPTMNAAMFLKHADMTSDQVAIAVDHLDRSIDFLSGADFHYLNFASEMNINKDLFHKIIEKNTDHLGTLDAILKNKKITDGSIKLRVVDDVAKMISSGSEVEDDVINNALKVPNINRQQFDALVSQKRQPNVFNESTFETNSIYQSLQFGGDKFRDAGITRGMETLFQDLTGKDLRSKGPIKFYHGKDIDSFNTLLGMVPPAGIHWKDFKRANPKLAENPKIKNLFMSNKEVVTPDLVTSAMSKLPGSYHITFGKWDGIQRHNSSNKNLVVQFNLDKSFEDHIAQDPEMHQFFVDQMYTSNSGHPVAPRTLMWTRLDATSPRGWIIEEIQSDFDSTLTSILHGMSDKGTVTMNGNEYTKEKLLRAQKYFKKLLDDHVDVAHAYVAKLAKEQGVDTLFMHGKKKRADLSSMDDNKDVPKWLEYKYDIWPRNNGWSETEASKYPVKTSGSKKDQVWKKKLS